MSLAVQTVEATKPAQTERFYLPELDALRFFAAFAVFVHHLPFPFVLNFYEAPGLLGTIGRAGAFHDLRHSAASLLLAQGVQLRAIMELLGHSTIVLTANTYSHVMPSIMQDMADKMHALLNS